MSKVTGGRAHIEGNARGLGRWIGKRAKNVALLPLVLLVGLYSAFGVVFLVVPGRVVQAVARASRRLLGRFSRGFR